MATSKNAAGYDHAKALIGAGRVTGGAWSFSAEDGNKLLGAEGDDWANYAKWFLAVHSDQPAETKAHYGYPFGKNGEVYTAALSAAKGRAAAQGEDEIVAACGSLQMMLPEDMRPADMQEPKKALRRAYSLLTIKSMDEEERVLEGIATTPTTDRMGDIVEPEGATFALPLPLLYQHDAHRPIGHVTAAKVTKEGIAITARIAKGVAPFIDEAWTLIKAGLVRGLSIGFAPLEEARIKDTYSYHFLKWEWLELSAVTIPANAEATILTVKQCDLATLAASGRMRRGVKLLGTSPGASGQSRIAAHRGAVQLKRST